MSIISNMLKTTPEGLTAWVDYDEELCFQVKFMPKAKFRSIVDNNTTMKYNPKTRDREQKVDNDGLISDFIKHSVLDWKGMTIRKASKIAPLDLRGVPDEKLDEEQPFDVTDLISMVKVTYDLEKFLQDVITDIGFFRPEKEDEEKN